MVIGFVGSATDEEDGALPASAYAWQIDYHHDTHTHPHMPLTTGIKSGSSFIIPQSEDAAALTWYRIHMWVTDSGGRTTEAIRDVYPATMLSDMTWTTATNGYGPVEKDMSNGGMGAGDGQTIGIDGLVYPKGLGMHPGATTNAEVVYDLGGKCAGQFYADVGIDDEVLADNTAASVTFEVWTDGTKVYDSGLVGASTVRQAIAVDVAGKNQLKLVVTPQNGSNSSDHASWGMPRVTKCSDCSPMMERKRIGYYPVWPQTGDDLIVTYPQAPANVPWTSVSHLNVAFVGINSSNQCAWVDWNEASADQWRQNAKALIQYRNANYPGVKILLTVGGWAQSYRFSEAMSSANRTTFVNSCVALVNNINTGSGDGSTVTADGLDIDWEFPTALGAENCPSGHTCEGSSDPANFTATLGAFRAASGFAGKLLTAAIHANRPAQSGNIPYEYQNFFTGTPRRLDWVNVITYDYHGPWENTVNFGAPYDESLESMHYVVNGPNGVDDTTDGVGSENKGRVVLGLPFFGPAWHSVATPGSSGVGNGGTVIVSTPDNPGKISFGKAQQNIVNRYPSQCTVITPTTGNVQNRYVYCTGNIGFCTTASGSTQSACETAGGTWNIRNNVWISYEDAYVVGKKADFIGDYNWGGMMWWTQGEDSDVSDLTDTIAAKLASPMSTSTQFACNSPGSPPNVCPLGSGTPWPVGSSAITIQAENYDSVASGLGGEGLSYHDTTAGNNGTDPDYRNENVDIQATGDTGGGYNIGWAAAGEWMEYTINVQTAGSYTMDLRVATTATGKTMHIEMDGVNVGGSYSIPNTGNYQVYQTVSKTVSLTTGVKVMRVVFDTGSTNLNWIKFTSNTVSPPGAPTGLSASAGSGQVSLSWTAPSGSPTSYTIKRSTTSGGPYAIEDTTTATSYTDTELTNGTTYYYVVSATNSGGEGANSSQASATPQASSWSHQDVGTTSPAGSFSDSGGQLTIQGAGADVYGTADNFHFAYQNITGDATVTVRVATLCGGTPGSCPNTWTKAMVLMREGTATGAKIRVLAALAHRHQQVPAAVPGQHWRQHHLGGQHARQRGSGLPACGPQREQLLRLLLDQRVDFHPDRDHPDHHHVQHPAGGHWPHQPRQRHAGHGGVRQRQHHHRRRRRVHGDADPGGRCLRTRRHQRQHQLRHRHHPGEQGQQHRQQQPQHPHAVQPDRCQQHDQPGHGADLRPRLGQREGPQPVRGVERHLG